MKCWVFRKLLPLYIGDGNNVRDRDLPIFQKMMARHLEKCLICQKIYQKYIESRNKLQSLKNISPPQNIFDGYWAEIHAQIIPTPPANSFLHPFWKKAIPIGSATLVLLAAYFVFQIQGSFFKQLGTNSTSISLNSGKFKKDVSIPVHVTNLFLKKKNADTTLMHHEETPREYELNEVLPLKNIDTPF